MGRVSRNIVHAAHGGFLRFGFVRTSMELVGRRAEFSRPRLHRSLRDQDDIFGAVFADCLVSPQPGCLRADRPADRAASP